MDSTVFAKDKRISRAAIVYYAIAGIITLLALALRFAYLTLRPLHHDEGVNGWFLTNLFREGIYKYDPANYHGPTLYYIALVFVQAFGLNTFTIRASVAVWGVFIVLAAYWLRPYFSSKATHLTAFFLATSPGLVFISRYFIHETFFVFLSFAALIVILQYIRRQSAGAIATIAFSAILFIALLIPLMKLANASLPDGYVAIALQIIAILASAGITYVITRLALSRDGGREIYLLLAAACLALMFATKETAFITIGVMAISAFCVYFRECIAAAASLRKSPLKLILIAAAAGVLFDIVIKYKLPETAGDFGKNTSELAGLENPDAFEIVFYLLGLAVPPLLVAALYLFDRRKQDLPKQASLFTKIRDAIPHGGKGLPAFAASAVLFAYIIVFFFTSLFTYADGIKGFFEAYDIWTKTGSKDHTQNGFWAYAIWEMQSDGAIIISALLGSALALLKSTNRLAMFVSFWWLGLFTAYTIIPYKTPWLALSFLLPACISAGYGLGELLEVRQKALRYAGAAVCLLVMFVTLYQTRDLNFVRYDDEDAPMIYAHTQREFDELVSRIEHFAAATGKGYETSIDIVSPDYWPLVWYLRDYPKAIFHGRLYDTSDADMIVAKKDDQDEALIRRFSANYRFYGPFKLRPGVRLVLLVKKNIPGNDGRELYELRNIRE